MGAKVSATPSFAASSAAARAVLSHKSGIEQAGFRQRDRENRAMAVDDVEAEQQGNAEAGFVHGEAL